MKKIALFILLLIPSVFILAQERTVKGVVTDETGAPAPGVSILVKGTNIGTSTNMNGEYSLKISTPTAIVVFSYIGYNKTEIKYSGNATLNVKLELGAVNLKETVVVGYGTQKKATMTGSVVSVSSKDLLKTPTANMATALIGRTPGLTTYQKSGQPGADGITLRIRGIETTNNAEPLILVDGVERDFTQLDPNEIESISVLKDAASTAVFGIRGANGVMIITTKKGEEGPARVSVTSNVAIQQPTRMPALIDAHGFMQMYNEALLNDNKTATPFFSESTMQKFLNPNKTAFEAVEYPNVDWMKMALKPYALQQQHNVTISGGSKNTKYYTSVGYFTQEGLTKDFGQQVNDRQLNNEYAYDRFNLRSNIDVDVTPTTKIGVMISGVISKINQPTDIWSTLLSTTPISGPTIYNGMVISAGASSVPILSPLSNMIGNSNTEKNQNTIALTLNFNQKLDFITKGLLLRGLGSYDSYYLHNITRGQGTVTYSIVYLPDANGNIAMQFKPSGEQFLVTTSDAWGRSRKMHGELALEYKNTFGKHTIGGLLLATADKKWYTTDVLKDKYYTVPMSYLGVVGRFTYDYSSKYLFEVNMGYNGSENFPANKRYALFPALSIGWNVAEEQFVKDNISDDILGKFKLRGSYGVVGNDVSYGTDANGNAVQYRFLYLPTPYYSGGGAVMGDVTSPTNQAGFIGGALGNTNVTWETAAKQNFGFELSMLKNQFAFNFDLFKSDRKDILMRQNTMPIHTALPPDTYNLGLTTNQGFEMDGKWRQDLGGFSYFIGGNYSFSRNKIIEMDEVMDINNPNTWKTGRRIGENFGYVADGFFNNQDELAKGPVLGTPGLGETRYVDVNGDGVISIKDMVPIGNPEFPEINYGFNFGGSYNGFDLSVLFQGATNTTKIMGGKFQKPFDVNGGILAFTVAERWTPETASTAQRPRLTLNYANPTSYLPSTIWARDGSYLRLRNIELSYRFDRKIIKKALGIEGMRIYINGQNLLTFDNLKFIDPEGSTTDSWTYPQLKVYNMGLKVDF
ncbi:MAG: SusC/RagA family TonB-linked outer membrane protein [Paludibacter sp.]